MQRFRILGVALLAIFALGAVAAVAANAEEGFLPRKTNDFTFEGTAKNKPTLETTAGSTIACEKLTGSGTLKSDKQAEKVTLDFDGCSALGFPDNTLGDTSGLLLLTEAAASVCLLTGGGFGLIIEPKEVHIEVPAISTLLLVKGSVIGKITTVGPAKEYGVEFAGTKGKQNITECVDKVEHKLLVSTNGGTPELAAQKVIATLKFLEAMELMDS
jgi:hypothetical protein